MNGATVTIAGEASHPTGVTRPGMPLTAALGPLTPADIRPLAHLHRSAFPDFFLSGLGEPFLVQFYRGFLMDGTAVTVVARGADGSVQGAVVGTTEPAGFFSRLAKRRCLGFALASARAVVANPKSAPRLLRAMRYRGDAPTGSEGALLSSVCVDPTLQGSGVGGRLVEAWAREVADRGVDAAFLTTDADNNDAVNRFYQARGWVFSENYATLEGRSMNRYTILLNDTDAKGDDHPRALTGPESPKSKRPPKSER